MPGFMHYMLSLLTEKDRKEGDPIVDASKHRMVAVNLLGKPITLVQDPEVIADMYNKHNANLDKNKYIAEILDTYFRDTFITMPTNESWKTRRKAIGHMFFKQRLQIMAEVFKQHVNNSCDKWLAQLKQEPEIRINIAEEFERIYAHAINHICFGEDFNDDKFDFLVM